MFPLSPCTSKSLGTDRSRGMSKQANGQSPHWSGQFVPGSPGIEPSWKHVWLVVGRGVKATGVLGRGWTARLVSLERYIVHALCSVGWNSGYSEVSKTARIVRIRAASQLGPPCYRITGKYDSTRSGNQGNMPSSLCSSNTMDTKITCRVGWRNIKPLITEMPCRLCLCNINIVKNNKLSLSRPTISWTFNILKNCHNHNMFRSDETITNIYINTKIFCSLLYWFLSTG
jgi:hypothetical protein